MYGVWKENRKLNSTDETQEGSNKSAVMAPQHNLGFCKKTTQKGLSRLFLIYSNQGILKNLQKINVISFRGLRITSRRIREMTNESRAGKFYFYENHRLRYSLLLCIID